MQFRRLFALAVPTLGTAFLLGVSVAPAHADLIGATVTGQMLINGNPPNFFDPANGFVPNGPTNKTSGPTVVIAEPAVEYGFADGLNTITTNFTATQLILTDVSTGASSTVPITYTFSSAAFVGGTLTPNSDSFIGGITASLTGDTITLSAPSFTPGGTYQAVYTIAQAGAAAPEPCVLALALMGGLPLGAARLRRRAK